MAAPPSTSPGRAAVDRAKRVAHMETTPPIDAPRADSPRSQDVRRSRASARRSWVAGRSPKTGSRLASLRGDRSSKRSKDDRRAFWRSARSRVVGLLFPLAASSGERHRSTRRGDAEGVPEQPEGDARPDGLRRLSRWSTGRGSPSSSATPRPERLGQSPSSSTSSTSTARTCGLDVLVDAALSWNLLTPERSSCSTTTGSLSGGWIRLLRPGKAIDAVPRAGRGGARSRVRERPDRAPADQLGPTTSRIASTTRSAALPSTSPTTSATARRRFRPARPVLERALDPGDDLVEASRRDRRRRTQRAPRSACRRRSSPPTTRRAAPPRRRARRRPDDLPRARRGGSCPRCRRRRRTCWSRVARSSRSV